MKNGTIRLGLASLCFLGTISIPQLALAVRGAEVYSGAAYGYGRVEARVRFAAGDGVISSFFLWKEGSEVSGTFWNELDFESLGADCHVQTNALYGNPSANHNKSHTVTPDPCTSFHTYAYEWTPDAIVWLVDGVELRRETGATASAFADNAAAGMQIHFNLWPGDASFGGNFSPSILPVHQYVDWVQFSKYADGAFTLDWREDFATSELPARWMTGNWPSPKNLSTHDPANVNILDGFLVASLTADGAVGPAGASPNGSTGGAGNAGSAGAAGTSGAQTGGSTSIAGSTSAAAGMAALAPSSDSTASDGGCSVGTHSTSNPGALLASLAVAAAVLRRRRQAT